MRKIFTVILILSFLASSTPLIFAASRIPEVLCEFGIKFYKQGRYEEALHEFKKALLVDPNYAPALKYIQMLEQMRVVATYEEGVIPESFHTKATTPAAAAEESLDLIELQKEMIKYKKGSRPSAIQPLSQAVLTSGPEKKAVAPKVLLLDDSLKSIKQPIEIGQGKKVSLVGKSIRRFLLTQPEILTITRNGSDELLVTGKNIGHTYLHIWDDNGRWTTEWLGVFPKMEGPSYEELARREEETARNFKLRYSFDWSVFETGRRLYNLGRSGDNFWTHNLSLTGPTPYGNVDSAATISRLTTTNLTYITLGITDGQVGPFKGFNLRGGDLTPPFTNLAFPGTTVRGAMLNSPAFDKKVEYTGFWGRESGGRYGGLAADLYKAKHSFLTGLNLSYSPLERQNYQFSVVHGWGREREAFLRDFGYDLSARWNFQNSNLAYELASDTDSLAQLLTANYSVPKLKLGAELRDVSKKFLSIIGSGWRQGELGGLFNLDYAPTEKLNISARLDAYRDRLYPAEDNLQRWNEDFNFNADYRIDPATTLNLAYMLQNDLGRLTQARYQTPSINFSKRFNFIKEIYAYTGYSHQDNKNYSSPSLDYINDKINLGLRFSLIGELYYYANKEFNWLNETYNSNHSHPSAFETGLDWSSQLGRTPFSSTARFSYRDEEDAASPLSFLPGEDYIEGYAELNYRTNDIEFYGSCRVRNSWAENANVSKRVDATFNGGLRYLWDTGLRWDAACNIECYVFKDFNSDGLRQRDDPPVKGVKLWLGKNKSEVTDLFGYCKFKGVRGQKAYVSIDMSTLPQGFLLTVPQTQQVLIANNRTVTLYFGMMSHSEISGFIFEDKDGNGKFDSYEKAIAGIVVTLEDGKKAKSDNTGRYAFVNLATGEHTLSVDLNSVPVYYLPKVPLTKKITLFEGVTYNYNIPLRRIEG